MMIKRHFFVFLTVFFFLTTNSFGIEFNDLSSAATSIFSGVTSDKDGTTAYRSLLIPSGGRAESLGNAYTGLCNDISFINYNAGASSIQKETQIAFFHNTWISDSKLETINFTTRTGHFGLAGQISCFYVPFTEYSITGQRVATGYYSESTFAMNASYNFLAGYDFKGFALGCTFKTSIRGVPNYTDNSTNEILENSGLNQSGFAFMGDIGLLLQFNFLKYFASREPNVKIGIVAQNFGVGFTGLATKLVLDDPLPSYVAAGMSVKFFPFLTITGDIKQPINLFDITNYNIFSFSVGADFSFTQNISLLCGLEIKGGNPKLSAGAEFEFNKTRLNANYTLDLTSSFSPVNRISFSAMIKMGDKGRSAIQDKIDVLYNQGLVYYYSSEWEKAIETWQKILELDKRYDPAILGISSAKSQIEMIEKVRGSMFFN